MSILPNFKANRRAREAKLMIEHRQQAVRHNLPLEARYEETLDAVRGALATRSTMPGAAIEDLCDDPAVLALGKLGVRLRHPLGGINHQERDNHFIAQIQDTVETLSERSGNWSVSMETKDAARLVAVHDALAEDVRKDFLAVATQRICYLDNIQRTAIKSVA